MYLLDTDTYSNFLRGHPRIVQRVLRTSLDDLYLCAITPEELCRGRLAAINAAGTTNSPVISAAYDYLLEQMRELNKIKILRYDSEAQTLFQSWPRLYKQQVSQDARIAAVAVVNRFTVVTSNTRHFEKITEVSHEDWAV